jgi:hypothetical protein
MALAGYRLVEVYNMMSACVTRYWCTCAVHVLRNFLRIS